MIVFKVDIETIEASWRVANTGFFVSDPEGIIFMKRHPAWLYAGILPLTPDRLARTEGFAALCGRHAPPLPSYKASFPDIDC